MDSFLIRPFYSSRKWQTPKKLRVATAALVSQSQWQTRQLHNLLCPAVVPVLVLAGAQLVFSTIVGVWLFCICAGAVLIIQKCFSYCWEVLAQHQGLLCSSPCHSSRWNGGKGELGESTARTTDPNWPKRYPRSCDITLNIWSCGRRRGMFGVVAFVF